MIKQTDYCVRFMFEGNEIRYVMNYSSSLELTSDPCLAYEVPTDMIRETAKKISDNLEKDFWLEVDNLDDLKEEQIYFIRVELLIEELKKLVTLPSVDEMVILRNKMIRSYLSDKENGFL